MIYGYKRPVQDDREMEQQLSTVTVDKLFEERHPYAKKRIALENLLMEMKSGDELYVQHMVVLADTLSQFEDVLRVAERDGVLIHFLNEKMTNQTMPRMSLAEAASFFSRLQAACTSHRTTFGIQEAKKQGKTIGRPKKSDDNLKKALEMYQSKAYTLQAIKDQTGISKSTLYRYIDQLGE